MRKLFLMYGAPASGKSYILNKLRVKDCTIEVDKVRQLLLIIKITLKEFDFCLI